MQSVWVHHFVIPPIHHPEGLKCGVQPQAAMRQDRQFQSDNSNQVRLRDPPKIVHFATGIQFMQPTQRRPNFAQMSL